MSRHGGNLRDISERTGLAPGDILDFSANINPAGPPSWLMRVVNKSLETVGHYPDPDCRELTRAIAEHTGLEPDRILTANGSSELIHAIPQALRPSRLLVPAPSYIDYARAAEVASLPVEPIRLRPETGFQIDVDALADALADRDLIVLGHPNNPNGALLDTQRLEALIQARPASFFLVDEAFIDFVEDAPTALAIQADNLIVVRSFTKFFAIPGLRLGYIAADPALIEKIRPRIPEWSVNAIAQAVGCAAIRDSDYAARSRRLVRELGQGLYAELTRLPDLHVFPSSVNYFLCRLDGRVKAPALADTLLTQHRIAIRVCDNYEGLDDRYFRVAVNGDNENRRLIDALSAILAARKPKPRPKPTPAIMMQGTGSNAGKSILAAALCRIFLQDGIRVAPFKSQNMSNNSFASRDGHEIARAQVVQAQACRLEPDYRMSPILLKPNSDTGSQVILCGKPAGNMQIADYDRFKPTAFEKARDCYDSLADEFDLIVLEGAGSPGEVNLKANDIANMKMARHAQSPVLLVGDIDRGGVFAGFVGHIAVLENWERELTAGFLINKFRGNPALLGPALSYTREFTGKPVLGVVPYLHHHGLPEEDSVTFKEQMPAQAAADADAVDIAVIDLPHISNFTDIDPLRIEPDVRLRIIRRGDALGEPQAVILPGSKNTVHDVNYLFESGLADAIRRLADNGTSEIIGICGGFQMLGTRINDPHHIETADGHADGLNLLPVSTAIDPEKTLRQVNARHLPSNRSLSGYEIHHGRTDTGRLTVVIRTEDGIGGVSTDDGLIWGTYLHGLFDADAFRRWFIDRLRERAGKRPAGHIRAAYNLDRAFDRLADAVRENINMDEIYRLVKR